MRREWLRRLGRSLLRLSGWRLEGAPPDEERWLCVAAPHTSNWDFVWTRAAFWAYGVPLHWLGKAGLFGPPHGALFRRLGGIPVDFSRPRGLVDRLVTELSRSKRMVLLVAPEGDRRRVEHWRSGFHRIARAADLPVVLGYVDYRRRAVGLGPCFRMSDEPQRDLARIAAFYAEVEARYPEQCGPVRLSDQAVRSLSGPAPAREAIPSRPEP